MANSRNGKKIKLFPPSVWREAQEQVRLKRNWVCAHSVTVCELSLCTKDRAASPQMGRWKWRQKRWHVPSGIFSNWLCLAQTCARSLSARRPRISCTSSQIFPEEKRGPTQHCIFAEHPPPFPLGPSATTSLYKLSHAWCLAPEPTENLCTWAPGSRSPFSERRPPPALAGEPVFIFSHSWGLASRNVREEVGKTQSLPCWGSETKIILTERRECPYWIFIIQALFHTIRE